MSENKTGGPALPVSHSPQYPTEIVCNLTLRDYFAAKTKLPDDCSLKWGEALIGESQPCPDSGHLAHINWWMRVESAYKYAMADAMLKEREK